MPNTHSVAGSRLAPRVEELETALRAALQPAQLFVRDDSAAHAGHAGAASGGHFQVTLECGQFTGLGRIARHRLVYDALRQWIPSGIHALVIDARAPGEV